MNDTCRNFDALIARACQLTPDETAKLDAHVAGCGSCRELVGALKPVSQAAFAATVTPDRVEFSATRTPYTRVDPAANVAVALNDRDLPETTRYRITGEVGRGGIGRVMEALDQVLDRPVALKELFSTNAAMRRRFLREALITARLQHPSIVPIYDAGQIGGRSPFYAMKLVAGHPFDKSIAEATSLAQRLALVPTVLAIADAIAYAHSQRIIHRDLKPTNILVGKYGETIVIDWGLAKDLAWDDPDAFDAGPYRAASLDHTLAGAVLGTPAYMAPEQAAGESVDERADVYALGAILYHVVSGDPPHEGTTLDEMVARVTSGDVRPLTEREPDVPRDLAAIVTKAMALEPSERYPNAQGLADDLRRFLTGQLVGSHTYGTRELVRRWVKRHRAAVLVALTALLIVAVVGTVSVLRIVRARQQADAAAAVASKQRAIAEQEKNSATDTLANLLVEQGRQELQAGRPSRAAVYLSQAQGHNDGVALRFLLADAMRSIDAQRLSLEGHTGELEAAAFSPDGKRIVTVGEDRIAKVWDSATGTVVATLSGHTGRIYSASFSPDNSTIVTASKDETARRWDARTGKELATFELEPKTSDHTHRGWSAAFSPDGARVVATGASQIAQLWDAKSAQLIASFEGHQGQVYSAAFSTDGTRVVTASADHTAKVWDARTAKLLRSLEGHRAEVISAVFSPDGSQILTTSKDGTARLWSVRTGALVASLDVFDSAAYSPDGTRVVTVSADHTAKLWDAHTGKLLIALDAHTGGLNSAAFSADGARVVTASDDRTAKLWDAQTGKLLASFEGHRDGVSSASFSPDGTQILTASADGTAKLWDATPSARRVSFDGGSLHRAMGTFSPDGAKLVTAAKGEHTAKLWDARSGKLVASLDGHRGEVTWVAFDPAGMRVATASADHTAKLWDAKTGNPIRSLDHTDALRSVRFSSDGARVMATDDHQSELIWDAKSGALIASHNQNVPRATGAESWVGVSEDATRVVTTNMFGTVTIRAVDNASASLTLDGNNSPVMVATFSRDGQQLATANIDRTVQVWNARTGKLVASLEGLREMVHLMSLSPDGARVVTASTDDSNAKLWDARTGRLLASFDGQGMAISVAFSPDGGRVLTLSTDRRAKLWDERTGKLLASFDGPTNGLLDARFNAAGDRVIMAGRDGSIWTWDVHLEQRKPDEIRRIISARDPWTLSNGVLVPVFARQAR